VAVEFRVPTPTNSPCTTSTASSRASPLSLSRKRIVRRFLILGTEYELALAIEETNQKEKRKKSQAIWAI